MSVRVLQVRTTVAYVRELARRLTLTLPCINHPPQHAVACALEILADVADDAVELGHKFRGYRCEACTECGSPSADVDPDDCDCGCHDTARRARRILEALSAT